MTASMIAPAVAYITSLSLALAAPDPGGAAPRDSVEAGVAAAEEGTRAFEAKDYEAASAALTRAYQLDPKPGYLFGRGQAERLAGRCDSAIELYDRFVEVGPSRVLADTSASPDDVENAHKDLERVRLAREACASQTTGDRDPTPGPIAPDVPGPTPWYRDPAGAVLVGSGAAIAIAGIATIGVSVARDHKADRAPTERQYVDRKDQARLVHHIGIGVLVAGAAIALAGAIRWGVVARRERNRRLTTSVALDGRSARLDLAVRF